MPDNTNISVSNRAANRIREILAQDAGQNALRISVAGGGCSGFRYDFEVVASTNEDDLVIEKDGARVAIDPLSAPYMASGNRLCGRPHRRVVQNQKSECNRVLRLRHVLFDLAKALCSTNTRNGGRSLSLGHC